MASKSQQMRRRRRNGFLAAIALAVIIIAIIIIIIVSIASHSSKSGKVSSIDTPVPSTKNTLAPYVTSTPTPTISGESPSAPDSPSASASTSKDVMYVTKDSVNVRKEASTDSDKLTSVDAGTAISVLSSEKKDGFLHIKLSNGTEGYIFAEYLSVTAPSASSTSSATASATPDTSKSTTMYVTADSVNMRKEASSTSDRITRLNIDTKVTAYSTKNGWTYVQYNGKYGYISSDYLKSTPSSQSPTASNVTPTPSSGTTATPTPTPVHATSFAEVGLPDGIVRALGNQTTYLSMTKAKRYVDTGKVNDDFYYKIEKLDGGFYYVAYKGNETDGFSDVKIKDSMT